MLKKVHLKSAPGSMPLMAFQLAIILLFAAFFNGCQPSLDFLPGTPPVPERGKDDAVRLSLFLNLKDPNGPAIHLSLSSLEVLAGQTWLPISKETMTLESEKIGSRQVFLGSLWVPSGQYSRVRFTVTGTTVLGGKGQFEPVSVSPYSFELELPGPIFLEQDASQSLFFTWDVEGTLERIDNVADAITMALPVRQLFVDLIFAACPDIDTIFVIRGDNNWVVDSFGCRGKPTFIALDPDPSVQNLYVLAASESRIKKVELSSQRIIESFPIPLAGKPFFMTISPDGKWAYVLDKTNNYLSRMDLATGQLMARVRLGYQPQYVTYLADIGELAVSITTQTVSFLDPLSLSELQSIGTGDTPDGLLASNNRLYIAESGSDAVSIYDLASNRFVNRTTVGFSPRRLLDNGNFIYVSNYDGGSLSVIYPEQEDVGQEITGLGRPLEMVFDPTHQVIYVGDEQATGIAIVDSVTNQFQGDINLGARPLGMAIIP